MESIIKEQGDCFFIRILGKKRDNNIKSILDIINKKETKRTVDNYIFEFSTLHEAMSKMQNVIGQEFPIIYCYVNNKKRFIVSIVELKGLEPYYVLSYFSKH